jgi:hypothetical protein
MKRIRPTVSAKALRHRYFEASPGLARLLEYYNCFFLSNDNATAFTSFCFALPGDKSVMGDWNGQ